jgi:hypothetical protein
VSAWIKPATLYLTPFIDPGNVTTGWYFETDTDGSLSFSGNFSTSPAVRWTPAGVLSTGVWSHVLATWDGSTNASNVHIYVNGVETTYALTSNGSGTRGSDSANSLNIGDCCSANINSILDDVRVYNRILSATEITALYNYTGGSTCSPEGAMFYDSDHAVMQYCNGTSWVRIGQ